MKFEAGDLVKILNSSEVKDARGKYGVVTRVTYNGNTVRVAYDGANSPQWIKGHRLFLLSKERSLVNK